MQLKQIRTPLVVLVLIAAVIFPVALTLQTITEPAKLVLTSDNPSPLGYTVSLSLFIFPMLVFAWWFLRNPSVQLPKKAFWCTVLLLFPTGVILDILFGNAFFTFLNHNAVIGWTFPAVGGPLPLEEIIFYISGFIVVLLTYVWCDEFWLEKYNVPDYKGESDKIERILRFHPRSFIIAVILIIGAFVYKKLFSSDPEGAPWYFTYLTIVALTPSMAFFDSAKHFINWRAFSFTCIFIALISLIWEVTLALPYQWWGFQHQAMMGIYIDAWHGLPIEEIVLWLSVSYTTVIIYEVIKIWQASNRSVRQIMIGRY